MGIFRKSTVFAICFALATSFAVTTGFELDAAEKAQEVKIAIVDMQKVFDSYTRTKVIENQLNQQMEVFKEYAIGRADELKKLKREYDKEVDAAQNIALSDAERETHSRAAQDKYNEIKVKETELANYNRSRQQQIRETYNKMRSELISEIKKAITARSVASGYTLVIDKSGASMNEISVILYNAPSMDITDSIIGDLNRAAGNDAKTTVPTVPQVEKKAKK